MPLSPGPWRWGYVDEDGDAYAEDSLMDGANQPLGFYNEGPNARRKSAENRANRAAIAAVPEMVELLDGWDAATENCDCNDARFCTRHKELQAKTAALLQRLQQSEKEG